MSTVVRQHYIPASLIANFSHARRSPSRRSPVHVLRRGSSSTYIRAAKDLAWRASFYVDPGMWGPNSFDPELVWGGYESQLPAALLELTSSPRDLAAQTWTDYLVPFVASVLVRAPEFRERHKRRTSFLADVPTMDLDANAGHVVWVELQRILAPIMVSKWSILRAPPGSGFVLNDQGWFCAQFDGRNSPGVIVPITPTAAIQIEPHFNRTIAVSRNSKWIAANIEERLMTQAEMSMLLRCCAEWALDEIYGQDPSILMKLKAALQRQQWVSDLGMMGFPSGRVLIPNEFDWHRVSAIVRFAPGSVVPLVRTLPTPALLASFPFQPPLVVTIDIPRSSGGLLVTDLDITLQLFIEAWLVASGLTSEEKLKSTMLLFRLARQYGIGRLHKAEEEFWIIRGTLRRAKRATAPADLSYFAPGLMPSTR